MGWLERLLGGTHDPRKRQAEALNKKAVDLLTGSDWTESERLLLEALRLAPDMAAAHHNLSVVYLNQRRLALALKHARRAVQLDPRDLESQVAVARLYSDMGKKDDALAEYRRIVDKFPEDWRAHISLGNALLERGDTEQAISHLEKAARLAPRQELTHLMLATAHERSGNLDRAIQEYRAVRNTTRIKENRAAAADKIHELQQRAASSQ